MSDQPTRRRFLQSTAALAAAGSLLGSSRGSAAADGPIPTRPLGKTGLNVPILGLGTACCGQSNVVTMEETLACFQAALDAGMTYFDAARIYGKAEEALSRVLKGKRDQVIITTKAGANDPGGVQQSFETSLRQLGTDHVDILYWHDVSFRDTKRALDAGGVVEWLEQQKQSGKARFIGCTGHARAANMLPLIESGRMEVCMTVMNFVDRQQYGFEDTVLPAARKQKMGIAAMKIFGGIEGTNWARYNGPAKGPQMPTDALERALRYALSLEGVAVAVLGMHTAEHVKQNVAWAKAFQPLSVAEATELETLGKQLVAAWTPRFGPVA